MSRQTGIASIIACVVLCTICLCAQAGAAVALIPDDPAYVRSLDGTWRFKLEQGSDKVEYAKEKWGARIPVKSPSSFEPFHQLDYREDNSWHDLGVPGNWEMAGYSPATYNEPDNASGFYRKWIDIPESWKGRVVVVNFDGVQNGAEVWLNGKPVDVFGSSWDIPNYHEGGWTAWQVHLTPQVRFGGKNLLAIRVTKNTKSSNLDSGDYFFLGGIHRTVTLFSVPKTLIKDITVHTSLMSGDKAEVKVTVEIDRMYQETSGGSTSITMRLGDSAKPVKAQAGDECTATLTQIVSKPRLWSAEHPNLYPITVQITDDKGRVTESVSRRIGIREVTIKNGVLLVNGTPVKFTGVCRHDVSAERGTAVDEELWRKDLTLMKSANINAVRTSHYPYGSRFYDLCDEMGFYVVDELPYCWCDTKDASLEEAFLQRARETIARDKNHPCVIIWGIGNENGSGRNLQPTADLVKRLDPTRPRLVSCKLADEYGVELDDKHYTTPDEIAVRIANRERRAKWPFIWTENPNVWDVRFGADFGCLDLWCQVLKREWDVVWQSDATPGMFLWEWQDRAVCDKCPTKLYGYDPVTGVQYFKTKGVVDSHRNPRPEYYNIKMIYSPIAVDPEADLASKPGVAILNVTNRYSFTDLSELKIRWQVLRGGKYAESGVIRSKLAPRTSGKVEVKLPSGDTPDGLMIGFYHPDGRDIATYQLEIRERPPVTLPTMDIALPDGLEFPSLNLVHSVLKGDPKEWKTIDRIRGRLVNAESDPSGPDSPVGQPLAGIRSLEADIVLESDPTSVVGHVKTRYTDGKFSYAIDWTGKKADIQELGWVFEMPHSCDHFSWKHQTVWSVYPDNHIGRPTGTALPDTADVRLTNITRPDAYDFNSTKYNCDWATLANTNGKGLRVEFAADQRHHIRGGFGENGRYRLVVNKQCSPPRDISTPSVKDLYLELKPGDHVEGSFYVGSAGK